MAQRRKLEDSEHLHMIFPASLVADLDAWVDRLRKEGGIGRSGITRSDLIRDLLTQAVAAQKPKRPKK